MKQWARLCERVRDCRSIRSVDSIHTFAASSATMLQIPISIHFHAYMHCALAGEEIRRRESAQIYTHNHTITQSHTTIAHIREDGRRKVK